MVVPGEARSHLMLWWANGRWWIGKREQLGHNKGWLKVTSTAELPPSDGWLVYSKEGGGLVRRIHSRHAAASCSVHA